MKAPVRIQASDSEVWELTLAATRACNGVRPVPIRCGSCGAAIATVGTVPDHGVLFISSWRVVDNSDYVIVENGERLSPRQANKRIVEGATRIEGELPDEYERHATIALLALPPEVRQEYPDLMVRCVRDGDAVLDRDVVLGWARSGKAPSVAVGARLAYERPTHRGSEVRRTIIEGPL